MIAANKRALQANLTQGVLGIQTNLISLYSNNLTALATQAALIAGLAFTLITTEFPSADPDDKQVLSYLTATASTSTLVAALFVLTQATIVTMFGPTLAIRGATDDAVKYAATHMQSQQLIILRAAWISITALFLAGTLLSWMWYRKGTAAVVTVVYGIGYFYVVKEGRRAFKIFVPPSEDEINGNSKSGSSDLLSSVGLGKKSNTTDPKAKAHEADTLAQSLAAAQEAAKLRFKGILWRRQPTEDGGLFVQYYGVVEKGKLDLYKSENSYRNNENPVDSKPIKLWLFDLELDPRKYSKSVTSVTAAVKSKMLGNEDFSVTDLLASSSDLPYASKHFKFALVPRVASELTAATAHEFLAHDEKLYKAWTHTLSTIVEAYDEIASSPSVEHTLRVGAADVQTVVQAANNEV